MLQKIKDNKNWLMALILCAVVFFIVGKNTKPAKVESKVEETLRQELKEVSGKLVEAEINISKMKSEKTNKSKKLVTNADGSSVLTENESSELLENELVQAKSKVFEYEIALATLQRQVKIEETVRNNLARVNALYVYDSERNGEYEVNGNYSMFAGTFGANPERKAWRIGGGVGFNF